MSKVFVLGGTGFLGYYTIKELLSRGYDVKTMSLPPMPDENLFPSEVENKLGNMNELSDEEIKELLKDCEGFIYAAGADERTVPPAPALKFFYNANVIPTQRIARLARESGVKKFVIFGSYFAEFAERLPDSGLKTQGYPNTRLLQEQVAFAEGEGSMVVTSLRLPYIFGTMPGRMPLWSMFVEQIRGKEVFPALKGGTAMVTVEQVAEAAVGAMEKGEHRHTYALSGKNMKFQEFYQMMVDALGQTETTQVPVVDYEKMKPMYEELDRQSAEKGVEHGIHMATSSKLQTQDLYIDPEDTKTALGIREHDVIQSIKETLAKCVK
ncbi:NAD-dependent epimerase/dehydratase family protein [Jeotgalibaca sp. MA1X17-3]|uniref:NAD-dependent epimerase/dehydratase family protein n=1 Tax=Jeotgalibaca sp. MA1X17-3 TaxID=2908211 RepID=UPI001F1CA138|nr:NAD-dependent epimerase/dehydratase family protein [Jeotgalibaca sp. MA1X17-3]UJF16302.1 NAD-dependent epimerase/dehydratase family protein [Jeotgalibaca sp. MA1X17-3]